jgi:uncharacterized protein YndB with AHSA1/START domain
VKTTVRVEGDRLLVTRVYRAPRAEVFDAWVEASKVRRWIGCAEATDVRSEVEPKVGGKYDHHMTIAGVGEVPGFGRITEFVPPSRLAYVTEVPGGGGTRDGTKMTVTVDFVEVPGGTEVRLVHSGIPGEFREIVRAGWAAALEKLEGFLSEAT